MSLIPAFEIGLWNAWLFILPFLLMTYGLSYLIVSREAVLFIWPQYNKQEKRLLGIMMVTLVASWIYSVFVPLKLGTVWFYTALPIYLVGLIVVTLAILNFATTPLDRPNTQGVYSISRHPMYFGELLVLIGVGVACISWIYLLVAIMFLILQINILAVPEERMCSEKYGNIYREYMKRTPKIIGIPTSGER